MTPARPSWLRGLTLQLLAITVLPLTVLLLLIAFGSVSLHQQDMRALVGERDERAVQSAAAALSSELHHRAASISSLVALADLSDDLGSIVMIDELASDFDGGVAYFDGDGRLLTSTGSPALWDAVAQSSIALASQVDPSSAPFFSTPFPDAASDRVFVIASQYSSEKELVVAGAFSPEQMASEMFAALYPNNHHHVVLYLLGPSREILFTNTEGRPESLPATQPGVAEALQGKSGTLYINRDNAEYVVAFSPVHPTGWALITEERWEMLTSPSLELTQLAPLVIVPAFILALLALWFVATRIVGPLQKLEAKAAALAWGDFHAIQEPVGGISEVQHLQAELTEMSRKVQAAQEGLHGYIGAITAAQEDERLRLARELHDDTIQAVIALKQRVQIAQTSVKGEAALRTLNELESLAERTVEDLRRMTRALRPIYLEDLGLVTALEMLARETSANGALDVQFQRSGEEQRLSPDVELALYRITQEALSNIVRHARARQAVVLIRFEQDQVMLEIRDDGVGFDIPKSPTHFAPGGHFGLLGMHERTALIGGRMEMESEPSQGTRVSVWVKRS